MTTFPFTAHGFGLTALCVAAAGLAAPAWAQVERSVAVTGVVDQQCTLGQPELGEGGLSNFDTPSGTVFNVTQLSDPGTLSTRAASITLSMDALCNTTHRVVLTSDRNGLWRQDEGLEASGFGVAVPYRANLVWADSQQMLHADAADQRTATATLLVGRPARGAMLIEFDIEAGATNIGVGAPLMAGSYADILRVVVEAQ